MRTVLLTSRLGSGHTRAAEAIASAVGELEPASEVEVIDFWSLMADEVSGALKESYLELVSAQPAAYEALYRLGEADWQERFRAARLPEPLDRLAREVLARRFPAATGRLPIRHTGSLDETLFVTLLSLFVAERQRTPGRIIGWGLARAMRVLLSRRLAARLETYKPDAVVATQMLPATLFGSLRAGGSLDGVPALGVVTDYGVHDFWIRSAVDSLCVAHDDLAAACADGIDGPELVVSGMPLMPEFANPPEAPAARLELGLDPELPTVLVTGGGYGIGVTEPLTELLEADPGWQVIATIGRGEIEGLERLQRRAGRRLLLFDWCPQMAVALSAADFVVGKPGGLTVSEALACGRPFLAVRSLGGQESHNVAFLERHGVGRLVAPGELVGAVRAWLSDPEALRGRQAAAARVVRRDGAARIAALLDELVAGGRGGVRRAMS